MPAIISLKTDKTQTVKELRCLFLGHKWSAPEFWVGSDNTFEPVHTCTVCGKTEKITNSNMMSSSFGTLNNTKNLNYTTTVGWRYNSQ